jgi:hypothetical protein
LAQDRRVVAHLVRLLFVGEQREKVEQGQLNMASFKSISKEYALAEFLAKIDAAQAKAEVECEREKEIRTKSGDPGSRDLTDEELEILTLSEALRDSSNVSDEARECCARIAKLLTPPIPAGYGWHLIFRIGAGISIFCL